MSSKTTLSLAALACACASAQALAAPHVRIQVGGCLAAQPNYGTIGAAVAGAPAGAIISICPGIYPEQIVLTKPVTLAGVTANGASQPRIVPPAAGVAANTFSLDDATFPIAAQILAENTSGITITGITIDGTGNQIAGCAPDLDGILFQNASGTVSYNAVINQNLVNGSAGLSGCQSGQGIFVESSTGHASNVSIVNNHVQDFQKDGITANDAQTNATITGNTVIGQGATPGAAENGIQVAFGATASISMNQVADEIYAPGGAVSTGNAASGILIYDAAVPQTGNNVVSNTQYGIVIYNDGGYGAAISDFSVVTANRVSATRIYDAIDLCGVQNVNVNKNTIDGSTESAIHIDGTCTNHLSAVLVGGNRINGACSGILQGPGTSGPIGTNSFYNAATNVLTGSDICPAVSTTLAARAERAAVHAPRFAVKK